jgi:uncharacterized protein (TIGR00255 family)
MPKSMTGFGRSFLHQENWRLTWEIRSVNSRHLDLKWRLPVFLRSLEAGWERLVRQHASRGRLELLLYVKLHKPELMGISLNRSQALAMLGELQQLAGEIESSFSPDINRLLSVPQVWEDELREPDTGLVADVEQSLHAALEDWNQSRRTEGKATVEDLTNRLTLLRQLLGQIKGRLPTVKEDRFAAMRNRIQGSLERFAIDLDQERILQEIAVLGDRLDVSEEMVRLEAHLARLDEIMDNGGETGKKLDFTLQECFREINTLGNKAQDSLVSTFVVDFKAELEKCREQVQNLE